jgi:hypothetical protein
VRARSPSSQRATRIGKPTCDTQLKRESIVSCASASTSDMSCLTAAAPMRLCVSERSARLLLLRGGSDRSSASAPAEPMWFAETSSAVSLRRCQN